MAGKKKNAISWDAYFMLEALLSRERSKDPKTRVGATIVKNHRVISQGYNGTPKGMSDDDMPWDSLGEQTGDLMQVKDSFVVHAESNAIDNTSMDLNGATMYVTLSPCPECAKRIANRGISKVVCLEEYSKKNLNVITRKIFEYANVEYVVYQNLEELYAGMEEIKSYLESIKQKSVRKIEIK